MVLVRAAQMGETGQGSAWRLTGRETALTNSTSPLSNPPYMHQNEERTSFLSTVFFPFPLVLFFFLFFWGKALFFLPFVLLCHFHLLFFISTDILPGSFFCEREVDVCQERLDCRSLFQRGLRIQERRAQVESSQTQRGKSREEARLQENTGFTETGRPEKRRYILEKAHIENERMQKSTRVEGEKN